MADNVTVKDAAGATQTIGTEQITIGGTSVEVQQVKVAIGARDAYQQDLTNGQAIMANSLPVTIASDQSSITTANPPDASAIGTLTVAGANSITGTFSSTSTLVLAFPAGATEWMVQFTGTATSATSQVAFEGSPDSGTTWVGMNGRQSGQLNTVLSNQVTITSVPLVFRGNGAGFTHIRARLAVLGGTDSITTRINAGIGHGAVFLNASIPAGSNTIGTVNIQPVSLAALSGTITTATGVAGPWNVGALGNLTVVLYGTFAGLTSAFEGSLDNTNWFSVMGVRTDSFVSENGTSSQGTVVRAWDFPMLGLVYFRIRATALTSGTASFLAEGGVIPIEPAPTTGIAAGTNLIGAAYHDVIPSVAGVAQTPLFAVINQAVSASTALVALVAGKKIRVLSITLMAAGTTNVTILQGATAITGAMPLVANTGFNASHPNGIFETGVGAALNMSQSAAIQVSGFLTYVTV